MATPPDSSRAFDSHDHQICIDSALDKAAELCRQRNSRLTPVRQRVLELVWQSHKPLGAYQLLSRLSEEGFNSAPPTVYRALDFLMVHGLIHRIASLNAFIGCVDPDHSHHGYFLICRGCGSAQEINAQEISQFLRQNAEAAGFMIESETVELSGLCPLCISKSGISENGGSKNDQPKHRSSNNGQSKDQPRSTTGQTS